MHACKFRAARGISTSRVQWLGKQHARGRTGALIFFCIYYCQRLFCGPYKYSRWYNNVVNFEQMEKGHVPCLTLALEILNSEL